VKGATIETATPNMSLFAALSKTNIKISGGRFRQTVAGSSAYVAGVALHECSHCEVSDCEFQGMQWAGVYLDSSSHCHVANNHFHNFLNSTAGDKSDVLVYRNSSYNTVQGNRCFGGANAYHGIFIQDPSNGPNLPQHNKILNNWVASTTAMGSQSTSAAAACRTATTR
jgi:parallel beta-helix repeat protein